MLEQERETNEKRYLQLGWDGLFKMIFGNENKPENVEMLISLVLGIPFEELKDKTQILNNDKVLEHHDEKNQSQDVVLKVYVRDEEHFINLEANIHGFNEDIINRNVSYLTYIFSKQLKKKIPYNKMKPVIQINFTKHKSSEKTDDPNRIIGTYLLTNQYGEVLTEKLQIMDIYIENCYNLWYNNDIERFTPYEQTIIRLGALHCVKNMEEFRKCIGEIDMNDNIRKSIEEDVEEYQNDNDLVLKYDYEEHVERLRQSYESRNDERNNELDKRTEQLDGREEQLDGREEQLDGREEQLDKEKEKFKQEKITFAKNLLNENISVEKISKITDLTIEEIKEIDI